MTRKFIYLVIIRATPAPIITSSKPIKKYPNPKDAEKKRKPRKEKPNNPMVSVFDGNLIPRKPIIKPIKAYPQLNIASPNKLVNKIVHLF